MPSLVAASSEVSVARQAASAPKADTSAMDMAMTLRICPWGPKNPFSQADGTTRPGAPETPPVLPAPAVGRFGSGLTPVSTAISFRPCERTRQCGSPIPSYRNPRGMASVSFASAGLPMICAAPNSRWNDITRWAGCHTRVFSQKSAV